MSRGSRATVALLFADIEGSTRLVRDLGEAYRVVLDDYREVLDDAIGAHGGVTAGTEGDGHFATFPTARDAVSAAVLAQREMETRRWPQGVRVRARIGVHVGEVLVDGPEYVGLEVHRAARIAAAGHGGQLLVSQAVRDELAGAPRDGETLRFLGAHRLKDLVQPEPIYQLEVPGLQAQFPPLRSLDHRAHNLPKRLTRIVGRDADAAAVTSLVEEHRLVTIAAMGGAGKTRLAIHVGNLALDRFSHGVWFAELASLSSPEHVAGQVARALRLREEATSSIEETLVDFLRDRNCLLILDNCEHVIAGAAAAARSLLEACPDLHVLTTTREPLNVLGELVYRLEPLALPDPDAPDLAGAPAVRLFLERATAARPGFTPGPDEGHRVVEICRRLEGLPLAIELAAARLRLLTLEQIAGGLDDQFRLLSGGDRTAPTRHQTLDAVMSSSYELLSERERSLFRAVAVFAGGFTVDGAEEVCCPSAVPEPDFVDVLTRLIDISLAMPDRSGPEPRFRMLEPVRQYAARLLEEAGESGDIRRAHAEWCAERVGSGGGGMQPQEQAVWLAGLEADEANFRAALAWAAAAGEEDLLIRLTGGLARYWYRQGRYTQAREWFDRVLSRPRPQPSFHLARILRFAAAIADDRGDRERADDLLAEVEGITAQQEDPVSHARILNLRASLAWTSGHLAEAVRLVEEALEAARPSGDPFVTVLLANRALLSAELGRLDAAREPAAGLAGWPGTGKGVPDLDRVVGAIALAAGDLDEAVDRLGAAVDSYRALGMGSFLAMALKERGAALVLRGEPAPAVRAIEEASELFAGMGEQLEIAAGRCHLALAAMATGDTDQAQQEVDAALRTARDERGLVELAQALTCHALLACQRGERERAAVLHGAAAAHRAHSGWHPPAPLADRLAAAAAELRAAMGDEGFAAAASLGRGMDSAAAVSYALDGA